MPSERTSGSAELEAGLLRELSRLGVRGAYARRLVAEWMEHFRSLAETMPETEAMARLGSPAHLARRAVAERFGDRWLWKFPATAGLLWGLLAYFVAMGWACVPVLASLNGWPSITQFSWYAPAFNWAAPVLVFLFVWWISGKLSSPPVFRKWMLIALGVLLATTVMDIRVPEGYVPGSGTGKFSLGVTLAPDADFHSAVPTSWLVTFRIALLLALFIWSRRAASGRDDFPA